MYHCSVVQVIPGIGIPIIKDEMVKKKSDLQNSNPHGKRASSSWNGPLQLVKGNPYIGKTAS